jgi:hypothetical protein
MQLAIKKGARTVGKTSRKYQDLCDNQAMDLTPLHFLDQPIEVIFDTPPVREKTPDCPNGFVWEQKTYRVVEMLSAWTDFKRRGRMAQNMQPAHAAVAATRGSLNVGRYYFRVKVDNSQIFDIYYDRAMKNVDDRKGQWFVYRELREN